MPTPNARLQLQLTRASNNGMDGSADFQLKIIDATSTLTLAEVYLDADAFADLMSIRMTGSAEGVPAWLLPAPARDRLGLHPANVSRDFELGSFKQETAKGWAEGALDALGATTFDPPRLTGSGGRTWRFIFRHYLPSPEAAQAWAVQAQHQLDSMGAWA